MNPIFFDAGFYLSQNPDVAAAVAAGTFANAFAHFTQFGQFENRDPNAFFDVSFYLQSNPDVAAAIANGTATSAYSHFVAFGQSEDRNPDSDFDTDFYLAENPDVAAAVANGTIPSAFAHFLQFGQFEGATRAPNELFATFDEAAYLEANPDVAAAVEAGIFPNAFAHFLEFGREEERPASPTTEPTEPPVIDTTPPAAPTITSAALTGDTTPVISGTAEAGATVTVTVGGATYDVVATGGNWSVEVGVTTPRAGSPAPTLDNNGSNPVSATATDAAGNTSDAVTQSLVIDTVAPAAPTISVADPLLAANETTTVTFSFAEAPVRFEAGDVNVTNGSISAFSVDPNNPLIYTATLTPGAQGPVSVTVPAGAFADAAGNANTAIAVTPTIVSDTTAPLPPAIAVADTALAAGETTTVTFTFAEAPMGFEAGDVNVTNGSISAFSVDPNNPLIYTATLSAAAGGSVVVTVPAGTFTDAAGNANAGSAVSPTITSDTTVPTLISSTPTDDATGVAGSANIVLTFSEAVRAGTGNIVITNGAGDTRTIDVTDTTQVTVSGSTVTINPTADLLSGGAYNVTYAAGVIEDLAGNDAPAITDATTLNFTVADTVAPTLQSAVVSGSTLTLTYDEALQTSGLPNDLSFQVVVGSTIVGVVGVTAAGSTIVLALDRPVTGSAGAAAEVRMAYFAPGSDQSVSVIQDLAGNDAAPLTNQTVTQRITTTSARETITLTAEPEIVSFAAGTSGSNAGVIGNIDVVNGFTAGSGGDVLDFTGTGNSFVAIGANQADVSDAGDLAEAANRAANLVGGTTDGVWTAFTYGVNTYALYDANGLADGGFVAAEDILVQLTGLDVTDLTAANFS